MARRIDWGVIQSNQAKLSGRVLDEDGSPLDITGSTLSLVLKPSETSLDSAGTAYTPTIVNAKIGTWSLSIPGTAFATVGSQWYRLDVVDGTSNHSTANLGTVTTTAA